MSLSLLEVVGEIGLASRSLGEGNEGWQRRKKEVEVQLNKDLAPDHPHKRL